MSSISETVESVSGANLAKAQFKSKGCDGKDDDSIAKQAFTDCTTKKRPFISTGQDISVTLDEPDPRYICVDKMATTFSARIQKCWITQKELHEQIIKSKNKMEERNISVPLNEPDTVEIAVAFSARLHQCSIKQKELKERLNEAMNKSEERKAKIRRWNAQRRQYETDVNVAQLVQTLDKSSSEDKSEQLETEEEKDRADFWEECWKHS